jgi:hypothetical protein
MVLRSLCWKDVAIKRKGRYEIGLMLKLSLASSLSTVISFSSPLSVMSSTATTPDGSTDEISIGLIGMGDMGKMYARRLLAGGWSK